MWEVDGIRASLAKWGYGHIGKGDGMSVDEAREMAKREGWEYVEGVLLHSFSLGKVNRFKNSWDEKLTGKKRRK